VLHSVVLGKGTKSTQPPKGKGGEISAQRGNRSGAQRCFFAKRYLTADLRQGNPAVFFIFVETFRRNKMYTTYHLTSAQEASTDILDAIKVVFKSKPITITVEQDDSDFGLSEDMKAVLDERLQEDESTYLTAEESINQLKKKYGL